MYARLEILSIGMCCRKSSSTYSRSKHSRKLRLSTKEFLFTMTRKSKFNLSTLIAVTVIFFNFSNRKFHPDQNNVLEKSETKSYSVPSINICTPNKQCYSRLQLQSVYLSPVYNRH